MFSKNEDSHTYLYDGLRLPSVTDIIKAEGLLPPYALSDAALSRGIWFHKATALREQNDLDEDAIPPIYRPYMDVHARFLDYFKPEPVLIEEVMVAIQWGVAGTLDRLFRIQGKLVLADYKTIGSAYDLPKRHEIWHGVQTAGYVDILRIFHPEYADAEIRRCSIGFNDEDCRIYWHDDSDLELWRSCLRLWHAKDLGRKFMGGINEYGC